MLLQLPPRGCCWNGRPRLFPLMKAELSIYPLTSTETQLDFSGVYEPPFGAVGKRMNAIVGHRIAEASVHRFVSDVAGYLRQTLASISRRDRAARSPPGQACKSCVIISVEFCPTRGCPGSKTCHFNWDNFLGKKKRRADLVLSALALANQLLGAELGDASIGEAETEFLNG